MRAVSGHEFSGVITATGKDVQDFEIGDEVYGMNDWFADGATAEFCITLPQNIARKPATLSHEASASVPIGALTSWQGLIDRAKLEPGERVLVHGGAGAVGLYAVQLAHIRGAHVITTVSTRDIDFVKRLGADEAIDYKACRFEKEVRDVDVVFDAVGGDTLERSWGVLKPDGRMITIAADSEGTADQRVNAIERHWYPSTALDDLLHIVKGKINDTRLYRCLDRLLPCKTKLEQHLKQRFGELFHVEFDVLLYDLTSTYVEGAAEENPMMRRGYSRDHRPDCEQLVLALIVNQDGFPFSYELFDGNRADVSTVETILRTVERKHGKARRVWIFDRGVVSEENLVAIRKRGGQYLVGTPRSKLKQFEQELLKDDFEKIRPEVEVKQITIPGGGETYILCRTAGRKEKKKAIRSRFVNKIEKALAGLEKRIMEGKLKARDKMFMSLGRIQASHPQVADLYEMAVKDTKQGPRLVWRQKPEQQQWLEAREGAYLLRTNLTVNGAADLWKKYMQLTEVEAAFRTLKSELAIRPLFHQLEKRVKAHVLVAFLGYALQVTLKHLLKRSGSEYSPAQALKRLSELYSVDIVLPTVEGREIWLRRITKREPNQKRLLNQLRLELPERLEPIQILKCSADSAIA